MPQPLKLLPVLCIPVLIIFISIILLYPHQTKAELATGLDWVGLFRVDAPNPASSVNPQNDSNVIDWRYVDCTSSYRTSTLIPPLLAPLGQPKLAGNCNFTMPSAPGIYEFRMYANNFNTILSLQSNPAPAPPSVLAQSNPIWIKTTANPTATGCDSGNTPFIDVSWTPVVAGQVNLNRYVKNAGVMVLDTPIVSPPNPIRDTTVATGKTYSYAIDAYIVSGTYTGQHREFDKSIEVTTLNECLAPFIKTTGGDVHTNQGINTRE